MHSTLSRRLSLCLAFSILAASKPLVAQDDVATIIEPTFGRTVVPLLKTYCFECHSGDVTEAEIDLAEFRTESDLKKDIGVWIKIRSMLTSRQMPPKDARQPTDSERKVLRDWTYAFLASEAEVHAGDPGPVVLRRLSNAEYTYTIRDVTGVHSLDPARQFPVDGAAGEGFTNVGAGLVMSPSLVQKYLDAAKQVAMHAAFYPDGVRFSPHTSRRDLTDELLAKIQAFYARYSVTAKQSTLNLWGGSPFKANEGGMLPVRPYIEATVARRADFEAGSVTIEEVAADLKLSPIYLRRLWNTFSGPTNDKSFLIHKLRTVWQKATPESVDDVVKLIESLRPRIWKFNVVGHVGREGAPASWMEAVTPVAERQEFRIRLPKPDDGKDVVIYLSADNAFDGSNEHDYVLWRDMRLESAGKPPIRLRDVEGIATRQQELRNELVQKIGVYLAAAAEVKDVSRIAEAAKRREIKPELLRILVQYLGGSAGGAVEVAGHYTQKLQNGTHTFIKGWGSDATPLVVSNSSDDQVRVPGIARPHGVIVHPSPALYTAVGWHSPVDAVVNISARIADAHPECGNGVEWFLQHRSGMDVSSLWYGVINQGASADMPSKTISVSKGELIAFIVGPRDGNHSCDLTAIDLTITETDGQKRVWDLSEDVADSIQESNPHKDRHGHDSVWHFYQGEMSSVSSDAAPALRVPFGSLLAKWRDTPDKREELAAQIATLLTSVKLATKTENTPDGLLFHQLHNIEIPLSSGLYEDIQPDKRFGRHPIGHAIDADHLVVRAPQVQEFRIPAEFATGRELIVAGMYDVGHGTEGMTQLSVAFTKDIPPDAPVICKADSNARKRADAAFEEFRRLFPVALCYTRIVPIDEVVTATLFHREDGPLQELMLNESEKAELERLWDELYYVSEEPLKLVVAVEQIREFATQDRADLVSPFDKMKVRVAARAKEFTDKVRATEPLHVASVIDFAERAWRRPLKPAEQQTLQNLYTTLRTEEIAHEEAVRLLLARLLTSPAFLYKLESPGKGTSTPVTDLELASRLSYFLWSSAPDHELLHAATTGSGLKDRDELRRQTERMLSSDKARRMAIHFACQWLHLRDFDKNDDKNEKLYPQFASLRSDMYEETVRFFDDMIRNNRSILSLLDSDATFLNESLAKHYGIDGVSGAEWRRVEGISAKNRGGVLTMATFLASQSGASRTSPILRGNWIYETLLGEKLPKPPAGVPQLPDAVPAGLTARQLIEKHSADAACAKCHELIDPYGFALEQFDAIGRQRPQNVDTQTTLIDGSRIDGVKGLQQYLVTTRRDAVIRQFCRKLLGYALGREVQLSDEPLISEMNEKLKASDFRFHVAVESIVTSQQFQWIRGQ